MERNDKSAWFSSNVTNRWLIPLFFSILSPASFFYLVYMRNVINETKNSRDANRNAMRGKRRIRSWFEIRYLSKVSRISSHGERHLMEKKISMLFLYESLLSKETTLKVCRLSVYLRHGRHLSCLWIMYANLQAGITRRNWCRSRTYRFRINSKRIA